VDDAGHVAARDEGRLRLELVLVLDHQRIGERDRRGAHIDHDLLRAGLRIRDLDDLERLGRPELSAQDRFHRRSSPLTLRGRRAGLDAIMPGSALASASIAQPAR
jgi:hypothetical protein